MAHNMTPVEGMRGLLKSIRAIAEKQGVTNRRYKEGQFWYKLLSMEVWINVIETKLETKEDN